MTVIYRSDEGRRLVEAAYRDALAEWPVSREEMFVETRHGKTFVLASGAIDAPPVVLFQGSSANSALWMNDIVELTGRTTPAPVPASVARMLGVARRHFRPRRGKVPRFGDQQLAGLEMPLLAIIGGRDAMLYSAETKRQLERLVPHARVSFLADAGHLLPRQTPAIVEYLSSAGQETANANVVAPFASTNRARGEWRLANHTTLGPQAKVPAADGRLRAAALRSRAAGRRQVPHTESTPSTRSRACRGGRTTSCPDP